MCHTIAWYGSHMETNGTLLDPLAVAEQLSVAPSTLTRWRRLTRKTGKQYGPRWQTLGHRTIRYRASDVREWVESLEGAA